MGKSNTKKKRKARDKKDHDEAEAGPSGKMKRKEYEREMRILQGELVAMQEWVKATGARVCIVFEGVDQRGQGGHDPADHRANEPAGVQAHRPARPGCAGQVADVHPALHRALPVGRARS